MAKGFENKLEDELDGELEEGVIPVKDIWGGFAKIIITAQYQMWLLEAAADKIPIQSNGDAMARARCDLMKKLAKGINKTFGNGGPLMPGHFTGRRRVDSCSKRVN